MGWGKFIGNTAHSLATRFGYDAVETNGRRKATAGRRRTEDRELLPRQRILLSSSVRDLERNFAIAAWAIRKHLDYVSSFTFQANTGDNGLDEALEEYMRWYSRPINCDAAGRFSLPRFVRQCEARRTIDGDVFVNFLADGHLQGIEGDRVIDPRGEVEIAEGLRWENGVLVNQLGKAIGFAVHSRTGNSGEGLDFDQVMSAAFCYQHGYYTRFDQVRGISPLTPAINPLKDVYENFDYALAKAKVSQLFALAFYREMNGEDDETGVTTEINGSSEETDAPDAGDDQPKYQVDFGKGPINLELEPGDKAEIIESNQPSEQFQAFSNSMIAVALKSLDIPFSFYDESHSTYNGQRQGWIQYDISAGVKREDNHDLLDWATARRLSLGIRSGDLSLPSSMSFSRMLRGCDWIDRGIPWIDPLKEITADVVAIKAAQLGPETACRQRGGNVYRNIDERARVEEYARSKNVVLEYMLPPVPTELPEEQGGNNGGSNKKDS